MKIATLVLNCVTAIFSMFAMVGTYLHCQYGQFVFFFTESKDPIFKYGEFISVGMMFLAFLSLAAGVLLFFALRKNKKVLYLTAQVILFPYNLALYIGGLAIYNYYLVRQFFYTGSWFFLINMQGIILCIVTLVFAIICFASHSAPRKQIR